MDSDSSSSGQVTKGKQIHSQGICFRDRMFVLPSFGYSSRMPDDFSLSSTDTIIKSPALNTIEPVGTAKASGKLLQPVADAILDQRQALLIPILRSVTDCCPIASRD